MRADRATRRRPPSRPIKLVDIRGTETRRRPERPVARRDRRAPGARQPGAAVHQPPRLFAVAILCTRCGWCAGCPRCESRLTLHQSPAGLRCHHCGFASPLLPRCPGLRPAGAARHRRRARSAASKALHALFPDVPVLRIDRDTTRSARTMASHLEMIGRGEPAVLVGTQMLAKGHHFPRVTLVGVLNADAGFTSPDFRAPEHTAQLIVQVAGRAGRAERPGEVLDSDVQSRQSAAAGARRTTATRASRRPNSSNAQPRGFRRFARWRY